MARCDETTQARFTQEMLGRPAVWKAAVALTHWSRFLQLVRNRGGVEAARILVHKEGLTEGFERLKSADGLSLTVEYLMLQRPYGACFTAEERMLARRRLVENGMPRRELPLESDYV